MEQHLYRLIPRGNQALNERREMSSTSESFPLKPTEENSIGTKSFHKLSPHFEIPKNPSEIIDPLCEQKRINNTFAEGSTS